MGSRKSVSRYDILIYYISSGKGAEAIRANTNPAVRNGDRVKAIVFTVSGSLLTFAASLFYSFGGVYIALVCVLAAIACLMLGAAFSGEKSEKKILLASSFALYLSLFLALTVFARKTELLFTRPDAKEWLLSHIYWKPFHTISHYGKLLFSKYFLAAFMNLFGNLAATAPMGFFLPLFFKKQKSRVWFFVTMLLMITFIEVTQLLLSCGVFDIDDYILNLSGSFLVFEAMNNNKIKGAVYRALRLEP